MSQMENSKLILSFNIKRLLNENSLQQKDLADKTGISKSQISKYISGTDSPSFDKIDRIADALNVSVSELFVDRYKEEHPTAQEEKFRTFLRNNIRAAGIVKQLQRMDECQLQMTHDVIQSMINNRFGVKGKF